MKQVRLLLIICGLFFLAGEVKAYTDLIVCNNSSSSKNDAETLEAQGPLPKTRLLPRFLYSVTGNRMPRLVYRACSRVPSMLFYAGLSLGGLYQKFIEFKDGSFQSSREFGSSV